MSRIYLSPPDVGARERELLLAAFDSNWIAPAGPDLALFERAIADACGRAHSVALASGTAAIHLGLLLGGVGPGDDVIVSSFTFIGSVNPIMQLGARPVLIDSSEDTWNLDPALVDAELARRAAAGEAMPAAVVAVDLYGQCADYLALSDVCARHGVTLVSDAAEALGASAFGRPAGSFGPWAAMSFNGNKIITTGGGGAFLTDDDALAERVRTLSTQARLPFAHYEHAECGFNYRMSNLLAAMGRGQVEGLAAKVARRGEIHCSYRQAFAGVAGLSWQPVPEWSQPNRWLTCVVLDEGVHGVGRCEEIRVALEALDIETRPLWKPMHLQPVFRDAPSVATGVSERLFGTGLCLPSGSGLSASELERVCSAVRPLLAERG